MEKLNKYMKYKSNLMKIKVTWALRFAEELSLDYMSYVYKEYTK